MDLLIVMDDASVIADNCKKLAEFLAVCRKYIHTTVSCVLYNNARESNSEKDFITD